MASLRTTITDMPGLLLRPMDAADVEPLTDLWTQGWRDGHAGIVPDGLYSFRTREQFRDRLTGAPDLLHLTGPVGEPEGFVRLKGDELDQFYVDPSMRGTGLAQRLMAAAEDLLRRLGHRKVWLACSVGNDRAARFYEKSGWIRAGTTRYGAETAAGTFELDVWRYEKAL